MATELKVVKAQRDKAVDSAIKAKAVLDNHPGHVGRANAIAILGAATCNDLQVIKDYVRAVVEKADEIAAAVLAQEKD